MTIRIRVHYAKTEPLRYTSNLDIHKIWERTLRRARLPLAYSQGFHPQPKINQACPLPLGITSRAEINDFWLEEDLELEEIQSKLEKALPPGFELLKLELIDLRTPKVQTQVVSADYEVRLLDEFPHLELEAKIANLLDAESFPMQRRGKTYDLRPLIEDLALLPREENQPQVIHMKLAARNGATGRADEVVRALEIERSAARLERTDLVLASDK